MTMELIVAVLAGNALGSELPIMHACLDVNQDSTVNMCWPVGMPLEDALVYARFIMHYIWW